MFPMLISRLRSHWLNLALPGLLSLMPIYGSTAIAQSSPLPERDQFESVPLQPASPFWQFPQSTAINGPSHLVQQFYAQTLTPQQLGEGDRGCFRSQSATVERLTPQSVAVILTQMGSCDDSLSGQQTRVDFTSEGDRWQVDWVGQRNHCRGQFWAPAGQLCP